jgi:hypothetical protein
VPIRKSFLNVSFNETGVLCALTVRIFSSAAINKTVEVVCIIGNRFIIRYLF